MRNILIILFIALLFAPSAHAQKINSFCRLLNADPLHVEGIGIVTGLNGTGDSANNAKIMLQKYFEANKYDFSLTDLKSKNIAVVRIDAEIKPFARPGDRITVRVTSIGDAASLKDGTLKASSLKFRSEGEAQVRAHGRIAVNSTPTSGLIEGGGQVLTAEMLNRTVVDKDGFFRLILKNPNFKDAMTVESNINNDPSTNPAHTATIGFSEGNVNAQRVARAVDAGMIIVRIPEQFMKNKVQYIAAVLEVDVPLDSVARIRINRSSGAAVVSGDVRLMPGFISYQGRTVTLGEPLDNQAPQYTLENQTPRPLVDVFGHGESGSTGRRSLQSFVDTLAAMRCTTEDVINILLELRRNNLIQAEVEVD